MTEFYNKIIICFMSADMFRI